jgi:hypothetical protein
MGNAFGGIDPITNPLAIEYFGGATLLQLLGLIPQKQSEHVT